MLAQSKIAFLFGDTGHYHEVTWSVYKGGEIRLDNLNWTAISHYQNSTQLANAPKFTVLAYLFSADAREALMSVLDVLDRHHISYILVIPYMPYARQDRIERFVPGNEAFFLRRFIHQIEQFNYEQLIVFDPHSDVVSAICDDRLVVLSQGNILMQAGNVDFPTDSVIVVPDLGAAKRIDKLVTEMSWEHIPVVQATKVRDPVTMQLSKVKILEPEMVQGKTCVIFDDICDGGRTFINLGAELMAAGARNNKLCVTHGLFTYGLDGFTDFDEIVTLCDYTKIWTQDTSNAVHVKRTTPLELLTFII